MKQCLSEETLLLLYEGSGTPADRGHALRCQICTLRYERLAADLKLLSQVLREPPPKPKPVTIVAWRPPSWRWIPVAVAGAAVLLILWAQWDLESSGLHQGTQPPPSVVAAKVSDEELARFFAGVVRPALASVADLGTAQLPEHPTNLSYLQAALDGGWPREHCKRERQPGCDDDSFALLFDE
ncbi:MAG: hypothetical protein AB7G75_24280 [Candidatus Binatia bacterium]